MPPLLHFDPANLDCTRVVADREAIRRVIPHRFEMEQLTAIVHVDCARHLIAGYKDVGQDEFWVRGHMPGYPLMPGILMCEASAQICSYYTMSQHTLEEGDFLGFGGMEEVRFRSPVHPGERLILIGKEVRFRRRQTIYNVQGFVKDRMVFHGDIIGVALRRGEV